MSFQAYLDTITSKTGKTPEDFRALADKKGLLRTGTKAGEIVAWLKADFGLGHGHAMAIVACFQRASAPPKTASDQVGDHFSGKKERWRASYDRLVEQLANFGEGVSVAPTSTYLSLLKARKKFGIIQISAERMNIGIKLKGTEPSGRLEVAGTWNTMVTHRVRVTDPGEIDRALLGWLRQAYEAA